MRRRPQSERVSRRRFVEALSASLGTIAIVGCAELRLPNPTPIRQPAQSTMPEKLIAPSAPEFPVGVEFGRVIRLDGVSVAQSAVAQESKLRLWLYWTAVSSSDENCRSVGSLVAENGRVVAREDDQIGGRRHVLSMWAVDESNVDEMEIAIGRNAPDGEYMLAVAVLRADNQTPVAISTRPDTARILGEEGVAVTKIGVSSG